MVAGVVRSENRLQSKLLPLLPLDCDDVMVLKETYRGNCFDISSFHQYIKNNNNNNDKIKPLVSLAFASRGYRFLKMVYRIAYKMRKRRTLH